MPNSHRSIAIVDDEDCVRAALTRLCSVHDLNPRAFASAQQLLDTISDESPPDCLILDVQMPGLGGLDVQARLRERGLDIPAIMITGRADDVTRARSLALGARAYLCKPMDADVLLGAIEDAIASA